MKDEAWRMETKEKIIRIVTEVLLLTNTWQSPLFYIFYCDWFDSPEDENEDAENVTAQKRGRRQLSQKIYIRPAVSRRISWGLLKQSSNLKCLHLLQLMNLLLPFIPHTIYTIPGYLICVHASTCCNVNSYRKTALLLNTGT